MRCWSVLSSAARRRGAADTPPRLIDAIKAGNRAAVTALLKQPAEVNARAADGTTALHWAVRVDDLETVRAAAARRRRTRRPPIATASTPLALAATNGNAPIIEALLKAGADANAALPEGETVLMTAARTGNPDGGDAARRARRRRQRPGELARRDRADVGGGAEPRGGGARCCSSMAPSPTSRPYPTTYKRRTAGQTILPRGGLTALMYAAREGAIDAARALADGGADLNVGDPDGATALILAIINAHYDLAALLLDKGADPDVADATGMTPLYAAVDMNTLSFMHGRPTSRPSGPSRPASIWSRCCSRTAPSRIAR